MKIKNNFALVSGSRIFRPVSFPIRNKEERKKWEKYFLSLLCHENSTFFAVTFFSLPSAVRKNKRGRLKSDRIEEEGEICEKVK